MATMPVGLSRDLPPKRVMRAQVDEQDLVIWRAPGGEIAAWDNRCPHRGMALSHGFVRGGMLACLYHGWHFGADGGCRMIPAHPDLDPPETIRTRAFSITENGGVIWVSLDGIAEAQDLPDGLAPLRSFEVGASAAAVAKAAGATPWNDAVPEANGSAYRLGGHCVQLLLNPLAQDRTQVTSLTDASASPGDCMALSRWCEAVRRSAEAAA